MPKILNKLSDYTESEFLDFLTDICDVNSSSEAEHTEWVNHFASIVEHPRGYGLIYYPEDGEDDSPEGILETIKKWRTSHNLELFKNN